MMVSMEQQRISLGEKVRLARLDHGWSKEEAARQAGISSITWKRIEDGQGVQDAKRYAALKLLGLNELGEPTSGDPQAELIAEVMTADLSESTRAYILRSLREQQGTTPAKRQSS